MNIVILIVQLEELSPWRRCQPVSPEAQALRRSTRRVKSGQK
jgi:hypothetical protein